MDRTEQAALNNAHLYQAVCGAHGCRTLRDESMLLCLDAPPRFFGQAVTLARKATSQVSDRVSGGFKDSFHDIEADPAKYKLLFSASWIWKETGPSALPELYWRKVATDEELIVWEKGWAIDDPDAMNQPRQFPPSLLDNPDMSFYYVEEDGKPLAGVLFNVSGAVVGISNTWENKLEGDLWREIGSLAESIFPSLALTGYERDGSLEAAMRAGFETAGPLRVWIPVSDKA